MEPIVVLITTLPDAASARTLAEAPGVDLHLATELLRRGCPESTAVAILL